MSAISSPRCTPVAMNIGTTTTSFTPCATSESRASEMPGSTNSLNPTATCAYPILDRRSAFSLTMASLLPETSLEPWPMTRMPESWVPPQSAILSQAISVSTRVIPKAGAMERRTFLPSTSRSGPCPRPMPILSGISSMVSLPSAM